ncbi:MAG: GT4 family glycosyltransferase PelF [Chlamydiales bacterium]|nr:GT4 family glycosyltransferase PelF [Chlamydiia bacterium]MCP5508372.1 GT4 family glycosyltransferase PelF [Chlamydiales bacterium]
MADSEKNADVCLILEGTFPYYTGGVSTWTYDLIRTQKDLTFHVVCLLPPDSRMRYKYEIPHNVVALQNIYLQELPEGSCRLSTAERQQLFRDLESLILNMLHNPRLKDFTKILDIFKNHKGKFTEETLLNSYEAWQMMVRIYLSLLGDTSFLNFFWSFRNLMGGFYSLLLAPMPKAQIYHTICTGFAGVYMARAAIETGKPSLITEHGIYTNERRIEIASADWLEDMKVMNMSVETSRFEKDLKDYWIDTFVCYSKLCYQAASKVVTLYEGNTILQRDDGADINKIMVIPNGIDYKKYSSIEHDNNHPPTIALIGRVVPIKDVKTYIYAVSQLKSEISNIRALMIGPSDEDPEYYEECRQLVAFLGLESVFEFVGKVVVADYLGQIDVVLLTSISEAQPLVILEAGAAGIPCVTTQVGSCPELIYGTSEEVPNLGPAGIVCPLANPDAIAKAVAKLMTDTMFYDKCSRTIRKRVQRYYQEEQQQEAYANLYHQLLEEAQKYEPAGVL